MTVHISRLWATDDLLPGLCFLDISQCQFGIGETSFPSPGLFAHEVEETAEVLKVSPDTVMRDWRLAKVWLARELKHGAGDEA